MVAFGCSKKNGPPDIAPDKNKNASAISNQPVIGGDLRSQSDAPSTAADDPETLIQMIERCGGLFRMSKADPNQEGLSVLLLNRTTVTDSDLLLVQEQPYLKMLDLASTQISDAGLIPIGKLTNL